MILLVRHLPSISTSCPVGNSSTEIFTLNVYALSRIAIIVMHYNEGANLCVHVYFNYAYTLVNKARTSKNSWWKFQPSDANQLCIKIVFHLLKVLSNSILPYC